MRTPGAAASTTSAATTRRRRRARRRRARRRRRRRARSRPLRRAAATRRRHAPARRRAREVVRAVGCRRTPPRRATSPSASAASNSAATARSSASDERAAREHRAGEERRRRERPTELVEHDREVGVAAAGAAVRSRHVDRRPAQLDHLRPTAPRSKPGGFGDDARGLVRLDDSRPSRLRAVDRSSSRSSVVKDIACSYRGRPSMRSPITFRWISFVPPPMSQPNEWM